MSDTLAFWDSSALVPICVHQRSSARARLLLRTFAPVVWWATTAEVHGAIWRLHRTQEITDADRQKAVARLRVLSLGWREISPDEHVRDLAMESLDKHPLRAADALQLAAALIWCQQRPASRSFLTADLRLAEAARSTGFSVIDFP